MRSSDYYVPSAFLALVFVAKLPALVRGRNNPLIRSVCALVGTAGLCFFFGAPPTISAVNELTGIPNVSGPLVYMIMGVFDCSCLVLIVNWRGGPPDRVRRRTRQWITVYAVATVALPVLFFLGEAPEERLRDLDTYYATTPYIREMIVLYLGAHLLSATVTTVLCLRWARHVGGWLRAGLTVLVCGFVLNWAFSATKLTAVVAAWSGRDLSGLSTGAAPPVAAVGALVTAVGFLLPLVGPRLDDQATSWTAYRRLAPLWRLLRTTPGEAGGPAGASWWASPRTRRTVRETLIHDRLLTLGPRLDDGVRQRATELAAAEGASAADAAAAGLAAMVRAAVAETGAAEPEPEPEETGTADRPGWGVSAGAAALTAAVRPGSGGLVPLARAVGRAEPSERREGTDGGTAGPGVRRPPPVRSGR
ncbi:MAB_1171c family putative transporter [Streptomyces tsukubensis]|uniref:MAB_1171c family putative transporter n=1 Tax=Streptomyces tsukubensis TaxID=83656 RepID=UPI0036A827AB